MRFVVHFFSETGTLNQVARAALGIGGLGEAIKNIFLFDTEMEAKECSNKGSPLYLKNYEHLVNFQWGKIIDELMKKQTFLAEVLLAIALPKDRIGNTTATEALVPVLGMVYGALMKQRFYALNGVQKMITTALANEQTHQKVLHCTVEQLKLRLLNPFHWASDYIFWQEFMEWLRR